MPTSSPLAQPSQEKEKDQEKDVVSAAIPSDQQDHASVSEVVKEKDTAQEMVDALVASLKIRIPTQFNKTFERKKKPPKDIHVDAHP
ncbi:hypothetical protein U1Q18_007586 [Sarracenia purpurea var. burkii]